MSEKIGVLLANLGTPDATGYWPMRRYLNEFLSDRRVIDLPRWRWQLLLQTIILTKRPFTSGRAYRSIWNHEADESPLMTITRAQTAAIAARISDLYPDRVQVDFCMRYGNPSTGARVQALLERGCGKILFFALYPQYAGATTGTANDQFFRVLMQQNPQPASRTVAPYYDRPEYIVALALSVTRAYDRLEHRPDILVASYHGMPIRYRDNGDPYYDQCLETTRLLRERLGWPDNNITTSFQSRFGTEEWLKPYTVDEVARLAQDAKHSIAVIAPAFSADCIETLEEINVEIRRSFEGAGGTTFEYIACLNDDAAHIDALV
ncbi:MAG: ferrochelatase, partial [Paracoccaceae bacterium]